MLLGGGGTCDGVKKETPRNLTGEDGWEETSEGRKSTCTGGEEGKCRPPWGNTDLSRLAETKGTMRKHEEVWVGVGVRGRMACVGSLRFTEQAMGSLARFSSRGRILRQLAACVLCETHKAALTLWRGRPAFRALPKSSPERQ